jgi:hypothetical protein
MAWWVATPALQPAERVLAKFAANREQSVMRQVGGRLYLTDRRLIFQPNRFDSVLQGDRWGVDLNRIEKISVFPRSWRSIPLAGQAAGFRNRLEIRQIDGDADLFVVNRVKHIASRIQREIGPPSQHNLPPGIAPSSASWQFPSSARKSLIWALILLVSGTLQLVFAQHAGFRRLPIGISIFGLSLGLVILFATLAKCRPRIDKTLRHSKD